MEHDTRQELILDYLGVISERLEAEYQTLIEYLGRGNTYGLTRDEMAARLRFKREDLDRLLDRKQ